MNETATSRPPDPVAGIAPPVSVRPYLLSVAAAATAVMAAWLVVLALSYIGGARVNGALGVQWFGGESLTTEVRLIRSFLAPWSGQVSWSGGEYTGSWSALNLYATLIGLVAVTVAGLLCRCWIGESWPQRAIALASGALSAALIVGIAAWGLTYSIDETTYSHSFATYFVVTLLVYFAAGMFSYGLLAALPAQLGLVIRNAWVPIVVVSVVVGLAFPFFVASHRRPVKDEFSFGTASMYAATVGSMAVPLATLGEAQLRAAESNGSPLYAGYDEETEADVYAWPELQGFIDAHDAFRVTSLGAVWGEWGRWLSLLWPVFVLSTWVVVIVATLRQRGIARLQDGAGLAGIMGGAGAACLLLVTQLGALRTSSSGGEEGSATGYWGVPLETALLSVVILAIVAVAVGVLLAALRPSPRHAQSRVTNVAFPPPYAEGPTGGSPLQDAHASRPPAEPPPAVTRFCPYCGSPYANADVRFCGACGKARV